MKPVISVIIPVRNGGEWLGEALASVLRQNLHDFEVVVVNDGADSESARTLEEFARADDRVRLLSQPAQGIVAALNRGIAASRGAYLARLDADDRASPDRLSKQLAYLHANPDLGLLGTFAETINETGAVVGKLTPPADTARLRQYLRRGNPFIHSSVMMRADLVCELGGYRAAFRAAEDYDLWLRMAETGGIAILPEFLVQYRRHASNLTRTDAVRQCFSVRLAQRSADARQSGVADPADGLAVPPDWWTQDETAFFAPDVPFYRFLDSEGRKGCNYLSAVEARLFRLNHAERKLAQLRLQALLAKIDGPSVQYARLVLLIALLHPGRAFATAWRRPSR